MQSKAKAALGLAVIVAASVAVYLLVPRGGDATVDVAARWAEVQSWTGVDGPIGRPVFGDGLDQGRVEGEKAARALLRDWKSDAVPAIDPARVPPAVDAQIERILAWGAAPRFEGSCGDQSLSVLTLRDRMRLALATAQAADVERAQAVLRVATVLQRRGSLIMAMVGADLSTTVAAWAKARGVARWPELAAARIGADDFVRVLAREAVCSAELVVANAGADGAAVLALDQFKLDAHARLAPLQIAEPTFATLRPLLKPPADPGKADLATVLQIDQRMMLDRFEKAAQRFDAALAEVP